jgi:hypothetical protein
VTEDQLESLDQVIDAWLQEATPRLRASVQGPR